MFEIMIPAPPSVNALYSNVPGRGRVKTKAYKAWLTQAGLVLVVARLKPVEGPASFFMRVGACNQARDLDGFLKAALDLFVSHGILRDDNMRHVVSVSVVKDFKDVPEGMVGIRIDPT